MAELMPKAENMDGRSFEQWRFEIDRAIADMGRRAYLDKSVNMTGMFNCNYDPKCAARLWLKALLAKAP